MISNMTKYFAEGNIVDLISYKYQEIYDLKMFLNKKVPVLLKKIE